MPQVITSDSFVGDVANIHGRTTDAGLGGTGLVWAQNAAGNGFSTSGGTLVREATGSLRQATVDVGTGDVQAEVTVVTRQSTGTLGPLMVRLPNAIESTGYRANLPASGLLSLQKFVVGVVTSLSGTFAVVNGDRVGLRAVGSTVALLLNDVVVASVTDTDIPNTNHRVGVHTSTNTTGFVLDDFIVEHVSDWITRTYRPPDLVIPVAEWDSEDETVMQSFAERTMRERSGAGSIYFRLWPDDPQYANIAVRDLVTFTDRGVVVAGGEIGRIAEHVIDGQEEAGQQVEVIGRGTLAVLDRARVLSATGVGGTPVEEIRRRDYTAPDYIEDVAWDPATQIAKQSDDTAYWTLQSGPDAGAKVPNVRGQVWPAPDAYWISPSAEVGDPALDVWSPVGYSYFRREITLATSAVYRISLCVDAQVDLFIGGVPVIQSPFTNGNPVNIWTYDILLTAGAHTFAARFFANLSPGDLGGPKDQNPNGWLFAMEELDGLGNVVALTAVSDDSWTVLKRPAAPPGMTVGQALLTPLAEAQARDALTWLVPTFTATLDSAGVAWAVTPDIATKTGGSLLTFAQELVGAGLCHMRIDPATWEWHVWTGDGDGTASGVTLEPADPDNPATGNLTSYTRETM